LIVPLRVHTVVSGCGGVSTAVSAGSCGDHDDNL
jgi:uncharacterized protein YceK